MKSTEFVATYMSPLGPMRMLGGAPALDLANTLHWRSGHEVDFIPSYNDLLAFCVPAQLLSEDERRALEIPAKTDKEIAHTVHCEVLKLRSALKEWLTISARNLNHSVASKLDANHNIRKATARAGGAAGLGEILNLTRAPASEILFLPLHRSAVAVATLVLFPPTNDIRQCEADRCGGFFINDSRSKPRRWCSMEGCGNRAKAARYRVTHPK